MIFVTGDTHGIKDFTKLNIFDSSNMTKKDYVIVAGDFGAIWTPYPSEMESLLIKMYDDFPFTTLFIDGNHENHERLSRLKTIGKFGADVGRVSNSVYHLRRGRIYTIDDKKIFCFGGAKSIDKHLRIVDVSWWKEEEASFEEMNEGLSNLERVNYKVDYIITHTAPSKMISQLEKLLVKKFKEENPYIAGEIGSMGYETGDTTSKFLQEVYDRVSFKHWWFGHFHQDIKSKEFTALYQDIIKLE